MGLITCPDCKKEISDTATSCPNCGSPLWKGFNVERRMCKYCGKETVFIGKKTNHILHLVLTVLTGGFWAIIWALAFWQNKADRTCTICEKKAGYFG